MLSVQVANICTSLPIPGRSKYPQVMFVKYTSRGNVAATIVFVAAPG